MTDRSELGYVYGATIERIKAQGGDKPRLGMTALMWISHAERPLQADELCHALAVELGSTDFDVRNIPSISTLVNCCQGLITVDKEGSAVRLIHFTLREYLSAHPDIFSRPHSAMAEICLTYLNSQQVKALSTAPFPDTWNTPFLEYCSVYWGVHAKRELSDFGRSLALELLKDNYGRILTKSLLAQVKHLYLQDFDICSSFSGLHCASFFGITEVVAALIEMQFYDINEEDFLGRTPLSWAASNGHEGVVKILLEREEVDSDRPDAYSQTPLFGAAWGGHEGVVKMLLRREDVNPNKPGIDGRTPLFGAARAGHEGVAKILLGRKDINPNKPDINGQTPLFGAAWDGHEGVVKLLLEQEDVNPNKPDSRGQTPLYCAAWAGHEGVVNMLLGHDDINPDKPDVYGQTPFFGAASNGHERVVEVLLGRGDVDPDKPNKNGQTPLFGAAWDGHEEVAKILLGHDDVNPGKLDKSGRTPLWWAAKSGHAGVVALLQPLASTASSAP